jgi:ATP-dependent 26S proteasome regulatory subunit
LIGTISDKKFLYIDSSLLKNITSSAFISFLLEYRNSIVVLEDCEKILSKREEGNPFMGTLLNLTDGIIGETVNCKFICSFNCAESKIDEALLRKGRLSLKYTFNNLSLEKTQLLVPEAKRGMVLADIYHKDKENVINKQEVKKIGF